MWWRIGIAILIILGGTPVHGAVVINEIAWMGTTNSASDEWIELYNTATSSVDISGWIVRAADDVPTVVLEGSVDGNDYFLLERTDDTSVPDVTADQLYVGGLGNGGETLRLFDSGGVVQDEVVGGENWESVGGNNETKHTPQRQADGGWITGLPTPKMVNTTKESGDSTATSSSEEGMSSSPKVERQYEQRIFTHIFGGNRYSTVGSVVTFRGIAFRESGRKERGVRYVWNMGNGERRFGEDVQMAYQAPGEYSVVLTVVAGYEETQKTVHVVVVPTHVAVHRREGYVVIHNTSAVPLDLSEWALSDGEHSFTFPEATIVGVDHEAAFLHTVTGLEPGTSTPITLRSPEGEEVARALSEGLVPEEF